MTVLLAYHPQMRKFMKINCYTIAILLFLYTATAVSHTITVFQCVNKNNRKVNVSLNNRVYDYQFGKLDQAPDIRISRTPNQLSQFYFKTQAADTDTGYASGMEIDFKNGDYTYTIYSSDNGSQHQAGVYVYKKNKLLTEIKCVPNTVLDNMYQHIFELPERDIY